MIFVIHTDIDPRNYDYLTSFNLVLPEFATNRFPNSSPTTFEYEQILVHFL